MARQDSRNHDGWHRADLDEYRFGGPGACTIGEQRYGSNRSGLNQAPSGDAIHGPSAVQDSAAYRNPEDLYDPDYRQLRDEHVRGLDEDYQSWRQDRLKKFSDEFSKWRSQRGDRDGSTSSGDNSDEQSADNSVEPASSLKPPRA